ncbi:hypothetical protein [Maridesulfovibrio sp. FT414]|uniref:hypothetical protein n=1 Tax=Maridesulfovibrio sp. FT414 TaxID=2979469 RepID=UPI003D8009C7
MTNVRFLWDSSGFDSAAITASAEVAGWPVANLQHPQPAKAWKCPSGEGSVTVSFDEKEMVTALALVGHNLKVGSTVTLRAYADNHMTEVFSQTFDVVQPIYTPAELRPCDSSPLGYPFEDDFEFFPCNTAVFFLDKTLFQWAFKVEINNGANPFHVGRMLLCKHFEPRRNVSHGWSDSMTDDSRIERSIGGQAYVDEHRRRRIFSFSLKYLTQGEVYGPLAKIRSYCGVSRPLIVSLTPDKAILRERTSIYCRMKTTPPVVCDNPGNYSANFTIEEVL